MEYKDYKISIAYNKDSHFKNRSIYLKNLKTNTGIELDVKWTGIIIPTDKTIFNLKIGRKNLNKLIKDLKEIIDLHIDSETIFNTEGK
jgi:hypothetical protein